MSSTPAFLPYSPSNELEWLENYLSTNYYKTPYNRFNWWRNYCLKTQPLHNRKPLRERIANGDFDTSSYRYEAEVCEHKLNKMFTESRGDMGVYSERSALEVQRRKRLLEDFTKDENNKLLQLETAFRNTFVISKDNYEDEIINFEGSLLEFYDYIESKYK